MVTNINAIDLTKPKTPVVKPTLPFLYKVEGKHVLMNGLMDKNIYFETPSNPFKPNETERKKQAIMSKLNWQVKKETKKISFKMMDNTGVVPSFLSLLSWTTRAISDHSSPREPITKGAFISAFFYDEKTKDLLLDVFIAIYTGTPKDKDKFIECTQVKDMELNTVKDALNSGKCIWYDNSNNHCSLEALLSILLQFHNQQELQEHPQLWQLLFL